MAFFNRARCVLKQYMTVSKNINYEITGASSSISQTIRRMCSSKVSVEGLAWDTDDWSFREAFSGYGFVEEARVIFDRKSGRSIGFGFVTFDNSESASATIQAMDLRELHGRTIRVNYANDIPQSESDVDSS